MNAFGSEQKLASMYALQERLLTLEMLVSGHSKQPMPTTPNTTVLAKVHTLHQDIQRLESPTQHLPDFYRRYKRLHKRLDLDVTQTEDGSEEEIPRDQPQDEVHSAGLKTKAAIICSYSEEALYMHQQTKLISSHLELLENERFREVPVLLQELKPIEAIHMGQMEAGAILNTQFNDLIDSYNSMINLVSMQFLVWSELLSKWEKQLGIAQEGEPPEDRKGKKKNDRKEEIEESS